MFRSNTPWTQRVAKQHAHLSHHDAGWWRVMYARHGFNRREIMRLLSRFKALVCLGDDPRGIGTLPRLDAPLLVSQQLCV